MTYLIAWIATGLCFAVIDAIWLTNAVPRIYRPMIGEILAPRVNMGAAIAFYLIYVTGIVFFAVRPALDEASLATAAFYGGRIRLLRLRHLRSHQPSRAQSLGHAPHHHRHGLGHYRHSDSSNGRLRSRGAVQLSAVLYDYGLQFARAQIQFDTAALNCGA